MNLEEEIILGSQEEKDLCEAADDICSQEDRELMFNYAKIRREELKENPTGDVGTLQMHNQVEQICKEWDGYTKEIKQRFR